MPQLLIVADDDLVVKTNRQRQDFDQAYILQLADSIDKNGLLHPPVVRVAEDEFTLVVGECRIRALRHLWFKKKEVRCGGEIIPAGFIPCTSLGDLDPIDAESAELEENIRRKDLTWAERANAIARLADLRQRQAALLGKPIPTTADLTRELKPELTAGKTALGALHGEVREDIMLGRALQDPTKAAALAGSTSKKDAIKALKRHEETQRNAELGRTVGATFTAAQHSLLRGNCLDIVASLPESSFDVILTDPPYGIDAQDYGDSAGKTGGAHFYDDSPQAMWELMLHVQKWLFHVAKPQAHLYMFCDVEHFVKLRDQTAAHGWKCFRTPFIWVNPTGMRAPWPEQGPQRKWQAILYAVKGDRPVTRLYSDVLTYPSDPNLGHQAQKPVALYSDLIRRSVRPGDRVFDPFCGTGTIFPAAHANVCAATGIELDEAAFGIATKRLQEMK